MKVLAHRRGTDTPACLVEASHRSAQSSMETKRPAGRIRAQGSRVRPASPGFRDIGFFGALPPGHLTSQSRRPTTAPAATSRDHAHRALAPGGMALENIKASGLRWRNVGAVQPALGRALTNSALEGALSSQNKQVFMSVLALGTHGKEELRQLLDEGLVLLSALPNELAAEICAAASENRHRNPMASLLCDSLRPAGERHVRRDTQKEEEDRAQLQEGLALLVTHGAQLLEKIQETMGGDTVRLLVDSIKIMRSSSALASFLSEQLQKVSAQVSSPEREDGMFVDVARQLQMLSEEGRALMFQLDAENATSLAQTLVASSRTSPVASLLFLELLEGASAREEVVEEVEKIAAATVADGIEMQMLPGEDASPTHFSTDQLDQLEYSAISAISSMASSTPARKARKGASSVCHSPASISILPQRRQESPIVPQMRSLGGANYLDLDVEMLKQNLGDISLAKEVPRQKANGRFQAGIPFARQNMSLKTETGVLRKDLALMKSLDNMEDRKYTHAWRVRDKDVSASPFIASTTKVRAIRAIVEERKGLINLAHVKDFDTATTDAAPDVNRHIATTSPGRIRASRRPLTGITRPRTADGLSRPRSSQEHYAQASLQWTAPPKPAATLRQDAMTLLEPKTEQHQYMHPTIYKLTTYEDVDSRVRSYVQQKSQRPQNLSVGSGSKPYSHVHVLAAVVVQRYVRGMLSRMKFLQEQKKTEFMKSLIALKSLKQSELNRLYEQALQRDYVGESLDNEAKRTVDAVNAISKKENQQALEADKRLKKEAEELEDAKAIAMKELAEANEAELRIEKEYTEMLSWKIKCDRARINYEDTKRELGIETDEDEETLGLHHPEALRDKKYYEGILKRYNKEREDYDNAREQAEKEKREAQEALERCEKERIEWQNAAEQAHREKARVEALAVARNFTDPCVSVKEGIRAYAPCGVEPTQFIKPSGNKNLVSLGLIKANSHRTYAGEFRRVQEVPIEVGRTSFNKHAVEGGKISVLNWEIIGARRPSRGRELHYPKLAYALTEKTDFTQDEWDAFGINAEELLKGDFVRAGNSFLTPSAKHLDATGLIRAMREVGRRINLDESKRLGRAFDVSGDGAVHLEEFALGLNSMVGMDLPHGYGQETFQDGSQYVGQYYEDKRFGTGLYVSSKHFFYIGTWELGIRHGKGIEGRYSSKRREAMLPSCITTYVHGHRTKVERFQTKNPQHMRMFKDVIHVCSQATKVASKARTLVAADVYRHALRTNMTIVRSLTAMVHELEKKHGNTDAMAPGATTSAFPLSKTHL